MADDRLQVLVSGYASLDEAYTASRLAGASQTGVLSGAVRPAPRHGGCGPNAAKVLAGLGVRTGVVTWVGNDREGRAFVEALIRSGVDVTGVEVGEGASPRSLLIYDASGEAACYFHPSGSASQRVGPELGRLVAAVPWLAITVGPAALSQALLGARGSATRLAWSVKADPAAFPPELCRRLVTADVVCLNQRELGFVADVLGLRPDLRPEHLLEHGAGCVVLTRGRAGYLVAASGLSAECAVEPVEAVEPTGAGDAFFAGLLAGVVHGDDPTSAAKRGAAAAREYLLGKASERREVSV